MLSYSVCLNKINNSRQVKGCSRFRLLLITIYHINTLTAHTKHHERNSSPNKQHPFWCRFYYSALRLHMWVLQMCLHMRTCICICLHLFRFTIKCVCGVVCIVCSWKDDRWWEGSRSFETCHSATVYEPMTGDTHPSTSKFITVHHLSTCSVMTFSQSYKNPRKPVGINQCLPTFPSAACIHY